YHKDASVTQRCCNSLGLTGRAGIVAHNQHSVREHRGAAIGVIAREDGGARPGLRQTTAPGNSHGERKGVAVINHQQSVVGYVSDYAASSATVAQLQGA